MASSPCTDEQSSGNKKWFVAVRYADLKTECVSVSQVKHFQPARLDDFEPTRIFKVKTATWNRDSEVETYLCLIEGVGVSKDGAEYSRKAFLKNVDPTVRKIALERLREISPVPVSNSSDAGGDAGHILEEEALSRRTARAEANVEFAANLITSRLRPQSCVPNSTGSEADEDDAPKYPCKPVQKRKNTKKGAKKNNDPEAVKRSREQRKKQEVAISKSQLAWDAFIVQQPMPLPTRTAVQSKICSNTSTSPLRNPSPLHSPPSPLRYSPPPASPLRYSPPPESPLRYSPPPASPLRYSPPPPSPLRSPLSPLRNPSPIRILPPSPLRNARPTCTSSTSIEPFFLPGSSNPSGGPTPTMSHLCTEQWQRCEQRLTSVENKLDELLKLLRNKSFGARNGDTTEQRLLFGREVIDGKVKLDDILDCTEVCWTRMNMCKEVSEWCCCLLRGTFGEEESMLYRLSPRFQHFKTFPVTFIDAAKVLFADFVKRRTAELQHISSKEPHDKLSATQLQVFLSQGEKMIAEIGANLSDCGHRMYKAWEEKQKSMGVVLPPRIRKPLKRPHDQKLKQKSGKKLITIPKSITPKSCKLKISDTVCQSILPSTASCSRSEPTITKSITPKSCKLKISDTVCQSILPSTASCSRSEPSITKSITPKSCKLKIIDTVCQSILPSTASCSRSEPTTTVPPMFSTLVPVSSSSENSFGSDSDADTAFVIKRPTYVREGDIILEQL